MRIALPVLFAISLMASCQTQEHHDYAELMPPAQSLPPSAFRQSIHHSDFSTNPMVTNGDCYEQFQISIPDSITTITVPRGTTIYRREGGILDGHLEKSLHWAGHPGDTRTSIDDERTKMGIAMKITGRTMHIISFGAWHSFEGGSSVTLLVGIPERILIRHAKDQTDHRTADGLTQEGWFVIDSRPALKQDYVRLKKQ